MQKKHLRELTNVGKATLKDLEVLGIETIERLSEQDPTFLFQELERRTQTKHDPCVWDVFAAIIHEAKTGISTKWWEWTAKRKALELPLHAEGYGD
ncbi:helix-hairpin-helix domain-containing protein [Simkania sp.]|uniref:helix-hairpin-helix domain-containing protein n=1 Tax=Simkania sp. TaxID=34094 RepID=UPI003B52794F